MAERLSEDPALGEGSPSTRDRVSLDSRGVDSTIPALTRRFLGRVDARATPAVLALLAGLVSLALGCFQLSLPHVLAGVSAWDEGYDEGVYVGATIRLVHGVLPYRDFVLLHPPGFLLLMSPVALLGIALGSHFTIEVARCITVLVMAVNAVFAGLIMRPLGRVATATAAFALALWPLSIAVERSVELEPYLVFFCLLGTFLIFESGDLASWRRVLVGGVAYGFAVEIKVWAVLPIIALVLVCLPRWRTRGAPLALGIAAGAIVPGLPFFLAAPRTFVHDVIVDQLSRNGSVAAGVTLQTRFLVLSGIGRLSAIGPRNGLAVALWVAFGVVVVWAYGVGRRRTVLLEWFALVASIVVFVGMWEDPSLYEFYSYFPAAFVALLFGVCAGRMWRAATALRTRKHAKRRRAITAIPVIALALGLALTGFLIQQELSYAQGYLSLSSDPSTELSTIIPPGACVISDVPTVLLVANRFTPTHQGCPAEVDPFGSYLSEDNGMLPHLEPPPYPVAFEEQWFSYLEQADYVVLGVPFSDYFPWGTPTINWFNQNYKLVAKYSNQYPQPPQNILGIVATHTIFGLHASLYVYQNLSSFRN
jgi:hypothetical protein